MASLDMDCIEFDRMGEEIESQEEEKIEVRHIPVHHLSEADTSHIDDGDVEASEENPEIIEADVKLEGESDLHLAVIVQPEGEVSLDAAMLASGATQLVHLGSGSGEPMSLLTENNQFLSGHVVQLADGTTAVVQHGFQMIQLPDGTSALLPSGLFTDGGIDGSQLSLEQINEQIEDDEGGEKVTRQFGSDVDLQNEMLDPDAVSDNMCHSATDAVIGLSNLGEDDMGHVSHHGGRLSMTMAKTFKCSFDKCGRLYTTHHHLKVHMRSHTGDRPFKCDFGDCAKAFATGYGLKSHRRIHTGEKPYPCVSEDCNKAFKTSGDLQKHMRTHTGEKPFICPYKDCNRSFTTSNIRKVHIRTHTGERPYTCDVKGCGKMFASATNYKNHIRIHSGEKPYECNVAGCGKRFTEYSSLYKHHVVHTHTKPYPCEICGKTYRQTSTLAMHKRTAHGDEAVDEGDFVGVLVQAGDPNCSAKRPTAFHLTDDGHRGPDETDGNLVIDTSDNHQGNLSNVSSALLQQLPSSITLNGSGCTNHVLVITDPSQIEVIRQISEQGN